MGIDIREVIRRRSDLSTFVVHLTRNGDDQSAREKLKSILQCGRIKAKSMFAHAKNTLEEYNLDCDSQKCVCFTETPLEYTYLLLEEIDYRQVEFKPYGIAVTKRLARENGVNPVWYLDITPGHDWLTKPVNVLINEALDSGDFEDAPIAKLTPFIEQMGTQESKYRKEFWWEREWRKQGDFKLPNHFVVLCPESDHKEFKKYYEEKTSAPCRYLIRLGGLNRSLLTSRALNQLWLRCCDLVQL